VRDRDAVDRVLNRCAESVDRGSSELPAFTYEQGVEAGMRWLLGETNDEPFD
jgi:hypothetical protein